MLTATNQLIPASPVKKILIALRKEGGNVFTCVCLAVCNTVKKVLKTIFCSNWAYLYIKLIRIWWNF